MNPYKTLKAAFFELVEELGGGVVAAKQSRADTARISRYGSISEQMQAPIDVVLDLEQAAIKRGGQPLVTQAMAEHHGYHLVPKCPADQSGIDFTQHLGAVAKESGEGVAVLAEALADGKVAPEEAKRCLVEARDSARKWACLIEALERSAGESAEPSVDAASTRILRVA